MIGKAEDTTECSIRIQSKVTENLTRQGNLHSYDKEP